MHATAVRTHPPVRCGGRAESETTAAHVAVPRDVVLAVADVHRATVVMDVDHAVQLESAQLGDAGTLPAPYAIATTGAFTMPPWCVRHAKVYCPFGMLSVTRCVLRAFRS